MEGQTEEHVQLKHEPSVSFGPYTCSELRLGTPSLQIQVYGPFTPTDLTSWLMVKYLGVHVSSEVTVLTEWFPYFSRGQEMLNFL